MIITALKMWPPRRWLMALVLAVVVCLVIAIPTALIETPLFGREIPPTWWAWPSLIVSSILAGMLLASYVAPSPSSEDISDDGTSRRGVIGGALTFFAVGCPVCNKLVLLALGTTGAVSWFQPLQPILQVAAIVLLGWALHQRLRGEIACARTPTESFSG